MYLTIMIHDHLKNRNINNSMNLKKFKDIYKKKKKKIKFVIMIRFDTFYVGVTCILLDTYYIVYIGTQV